MIGYGAIGEYVFRSVQASHHSCVVAVLCRPGREVRAREVLGDDISCVSHVDDLCASFDVVAECAGHAALAEQVPMLLRMGVDVISVSSGALADERVSDELAQAAELGNARLQLVSGAIGALDALSAASIESLEAVRYRGRKPPEGWRGTAAESIVDLDNVAGTVELFSGSAREAALRYPKNANVAATIALAGIGFDDTRVELIVDPDAVGNHHEIEASGRFGHFKFSVEGLPLPGNPRSSALTAMSVVRALEQRQAHLTGG
ncbi:MAG: aspartate dehydrogenase [Granulosicoccus sp.]|nr:aspartate dehydrogenase [Granulosicoccus sp.]